MVTPVFKENRKRHEAFIKAEAIVPSAFLILFLEKFSAMLIPLEIEGRKLKVVSGKGKIEAYR
ncbi:MAG: hypothetical protein WCO26_17540 [Deltaproteobacteria bacterium]